MDASLIVTIITAVVGWVVGLLGVWTKTTEKITELGKEAATNLSMLSKELWKAINDNTRQVEQLIGKVDRDLGQHRGDLLQQIERAGGRIQTLETVFRMGQARREAYDAAEYLHKPEAAAAVVDAMLDELKDDLRKDIAMTPERKAQLEKSLVAHLESKQPDTGERRMLRAKRAVEESTEPMPVEPHDKAPDAPKPKHDDDDDDAKKKKAEEAAKKLLGQQLVTDGPAIITVVPTEKETTS